MSTLMTLQLAAGLIWLLLFVLACYGYDAVRRYKARKKAGREQCNK